MNKIKVASIQMTSTSKWQDNLNTAIELIKQARQHGAKLVVLPEFFIRIGDNKHADFMNIVEEIGKGAIQEALKNIVRECKIYLVAGTIPIKSKVTNKCYNTTIVYNPEGEVMCYYNKVHLFKLENQEHKIDESSTFDSGKDIVTFSIDDFSFGLSICYDLRFPELFREMAGVDAMILPAAFTHYTGKSHWEILLRARAIENQCYMIASAQTGIHESGRHTFGHSMIIDPWGTIMEVLPDGEGYIIDELDKSVVDKVRKELPALQHIKI